MRSTALLKAVLLTNLFILSCAANYSAALETSCTINGIVGFCSPPVIDPWWCSGNTLNTGSSPECDINHRNCVNDDQVRELLAAKEADHYSACTFSSSWRNSHYAMRHTMGILDRHSRNFDVPMTIHQSGNPSVCYNFPGIGGTAHCSRYVHCQSPYQSINGACFRESIGVAPVDPRKNLGSCPASTGGGSMTSHPINLATGNKFLEEVDAFVSDGLVLRRFYNSMDIGYRGSFGSHWTHTFDAHLDIAISIDGVFSGVIEAVRPDGKTLTFVRSGSVLSWSSDSDVVENLIEIVDSQGVITGYRVFDKNDRIENYDKQGLLQSIVDPRHAVELALTRDSQGRIETVRDRSGRTLSFAYDSHNRIDKIFEPESGPPVPSSNSWAYSYDSEGRLESVTDPSKKVRRYQYEDAYFPYAMTQIVDENGNPFAHYDYDSLGRASSENLWAGPGASNSVSEYTITFPSGSVTQVIGPLQDSRNYQFLNVRGVRLLSSISTLCSLCGNGAVKTRTYDPLTGFTDLVTDFGDNETNFDYNSRGLEVVRVEAANDSSPSQVSARRIIETNWISTFRVPDQRTTRNATGSTEAMKRWSYTPRGQQTARCDIDPADAAAMAYTCSATTSPPAGSRVRRTVSTYCEAADVAAGTCPLEGLLVAVNGPRLVSDPGMGGLDDVTTYTYRDADDPTCATSGVCTYRKGDLWKVTNALGQVTETVSYDKAGRVTRTKEANGVLTDFAYHPRGWLVDRIVRASLSGSPSPDDATTHIDYDAVGSVQRTTQPDGSYLHYTYDAAHRLLKVEDNLGNTLDYCPGGVGSADCLDAAGNRRIEQVKESGGAIKRSLRRTYNQLGQLTAVLNAQSQTTLSYPAATGYDANGNPTHSLDGLSVETRQEYDPLNRLKKTIQDYLGPDVATRDTTTEYTYDARDNLRTVKDPDNLTTTYDYDGLNDLTGLHSPDTGTTAYTYDLAGNRITQTDARNVVSTYVYDRLNRLTAIQYPTTALNVGFFYDQSNATTGCAKSFPLGRLTRITDASGSTTYCYDRRGNVTRKTQVTAGVSQALAYTWTKADRLETITYPSSGVATYGRNAIGLI